MRRGPAMGFIVKRVLRRVLRRVSEKGVSRRCLERLLGEYDPLGVRTSERLSVETFCVCFICCLSVFSDDRWTCMKVPPLVLPQCSCQATLTDLSNFASANYTALYKIFKKFDKLTGLAVPCSSASFELSGPISHVLRYYCCDTP